MAALISPVEFVARTLVGDFVTRRSAKYSFMNSKPAGSVTSSPGFGDALTVTTRSAGLRSVDCMSSPFLRDADYEKWHGWPDSNRRSLAPKASAMTKLRYTRLFQSTRPASHPLSPDYQSSALPN